jgi:hypothetical protein
VRKRIICVNPEHEEKTPSMIIYEEYAHCFGCGYRVPLSKLGIEVEKEAKPREKEDVERTLAYIAALPVKTVRGLSLPCDDKYYYIVFPGCNYYKKRAFDSSGSRYLCPSGHAKPLYVPYKTTGDTLAIVEGELNALSLAQITPLYSICSPGGTSEFGGKSFDKYVSFYLTSYKKFVIVTDRDRAGTLAAIEIKAKLIKYTPYVKVILQEPDYNEILQNYGTEGLKQRVGM